MILFSNLNNILWDTFNQSIFLLSLKISYFQGELSDTSAETVTLVLMDNPNIGMDELIHNQM